MLELLAKVLALGIASSFSPVILGVAIGLAFGKDNPLKRCLSFLLGGAVALALILAAAWFFAGYDDKVFVLSSTEDLLFGSVFIIFGVFSFVHGKDKKLQLKQNPNPLKWFLIGFIANITNFDAVLLEFTSAKIAFDSGVGLIARLVLLLLGCLCYLSPILIPFALSLSKASGAKSLLSKVGLLMDKYGNTILGLLFVLFGIYFIWAGLGSG